MPTEVKYMDRSEGKQYEDVRVNTSMEPNAICGKVYPVMGREVLENHPDDMDKNCTACMYIIGVDVLNITGKTTEELGLVEDDGFPEESGKVVFSRIVEEVLPSPITGQPIITKSTTRRIARKGK
jgi:hypothetical protein